MYWTVRLFLVLLWHNCNIIDRQQLETLTISWSINLFSILTIHLEFIKYNSHKKKSFNFRYINPWLFSALTLCHPEYFVTASTCEVANTCLFLYNSFTFAFPIVIFCFISRIRPGSSTGELKLKTHIFAQTEIEPSKVLYLDLPGHLNAECMEY